MERFGIIYGDQLLLKADDFMTFSFSESFKFLYQWAISNSGFSLRYLIKLSSKVLLN